MIHLDLREIATTVRHMPSGEEERLEAMRETLKDYKNVRYFEVNPYEGVKHKGRRMRRTWIDALESITEFPHLLLETDATKTEWYRDEIDVPEGYGILYLGLSDKSFREFGRSHVVDAKFDPLNDDWMIARGMVCNHAQIFMDQEAVDTFLNIHRPHYDLFRGFDSELCHEQQFHDWIVLQEPCFYQKDDYQVENTNRIIRP